MMLFILCSRIDQRFVGIWMIGFPWENVLDYLLLLINDLQLHGLAKSSYEQMIKQQ